MFAKDMGAQAPLNTVEPANQDLSAQPAQAAPLAHDLPVQNDLLLPIAQGDLPPRIAAHLAVHPVPSPCLLVDVELVGHNYTQLAQALPQALVYYAVKANPSEQIIARLAQLGSSFDAASPQEIALCLKNGAEASQISYGNTIKKATDIAWAYDQGVRLFAFDSEAELLKIAEHAPGSSVFVRVLVDCDGAEWPLSRKFGCDAPMARALMVQARALGLDACGLSFHVGSQQTDLNQWNIATGQMAAIFRDLAADGVHLRMINIGGGMPARYKTSVQPLSDYGDAVMAAMTEHFSDSWTNTLPTIIVEPGRSITGDAGVIQAEVVLISKKSAEDTTRWVYLDIGKFSGLAETMDEAIKYRIVTPHDGGETGPVIVAGPTCDSVDILYEHAGYELPLDLKVGDKVQILSTGAYTTTYSSVGFNGFDPLTSICI